MNKLNLHPDNASLLTKKLRMRWTRFWMRHAGPKRFGKLASRLAAWFAPPHKANTLLAKMNPQGYITPSAVLYHSDLRLGANILIGDRVIVYEAKDGGPVELGDRVCILRDTVIETGFNGSVTLGAGTWIHPRCQLNAYVAPIRIGQGVDIAPNCAFYSYDHEFTPDKTIREQPLKSKGGIVVGDHAWLGVGVIVLNNVNIGEGAVIGAGSVVTHDIPPGAIAVGVPARVVKYRHESETDA